MLMYSKVDSSLDPECSRTISIDLEIISRCCDIKELTVNDSRNELQFSSRNKTIDCIVIENSLKLIWK